MTAATAIGWGQVWGGGGEGGGRGAQGEGMQDEDTTVWTEGERSFMEAQKGKKILFERVFSHNKKINGKNFRITPYINYASALLSSKTMVNSPEYCIHTSVMNTYCVNKRGFQFLSFFHPFLPVSFSFFPSHSPTTLSSAPRFPFSFFFG